MKTTLALLLFICVLISCEKTEEAEQFEFDLETQGESVLFVQWAEIGPEYSIHLFASATDNFEQIASASSANASEGSAILYDLSAMTAYYLKIEVKNGEELLWSDIREFSTKYTQRNVKYGTTGEEELCASVAYVSDRLMSDSKVAIFMHEFQSSKSSWYKTAIPDTLIKDGYLCVAIDFKGHGCSSFTDDVTRLLEEPWLLREDFDATIHMLDTIGLPHSQEIVVLGASMGACVATCVSSYENVLGGVAASAVRKLSEEMLNVPLIPKGMFYLAGELDKNVAKDIYFEKDARDLFETTREPGKVVIVPGTSEHGVMIFESSLSLTAEAIAWVRSL